MVGFEGSSGEGLPSAGGGGAKLPGVIDWGAILARHNLETPGYKETVEKMKKDGALRRKPSQNIG